MVVGYDTHHDGTRGKESVGGFVSSINPTLTRWYSRVAYHKNQEEMSNNFAQNFKRKYLSCIILSFNCGICRWAEALS